jgi:glycosyltransferase involved in cell wall biosynthesis
LSRAIAWQAEQICPGRVVYYIASDWPYAKSLHLAYWDFPARRPDKRLAKGLLAPLARQAVEQEVRSFPLRFEHVLTVSQAIRQDLARHAGIPPENMRVVYNGVETDRFTSEASKEPPDGRLELLYAGSLAPHKGVHTALNAMALLADRPGLQGVRLTAVGSGHPDYEARLRRQVAENHLEDRVTFVPRQERSQMPALMRRFDALVFPSVWQEPLARTVQEAMASGLVVIGTLTGGTPEILSEGETGLTFAPGDAAGLADQIERLHHSPELYARLRANARRIVLEKFDLERMIDEIEDRLADVYRQSAAVTNPQPADREMLSGRRI